MKEILDAIQSPESTPADFAAHVAAERAKWSAAVRASGARMD